MVLQSGVRPYCFDYPMPYSIGGDPSGQIGFLLEQAMWVAVAEKRRLNPDSVIQNDHFQIIEFTGVGRLGFTTIDIEPTPEGKIFGFPFHANDPIYAGAMDYIVAVRRAVSSMISSFDALYSSSECEGDFLNNWYPNSSGQVFLYSDTGTVSGPHTRKEIELPVTGFPPEGVPTEICSTDINSLGGSGVLFDRDYGELLYNPYPWIAERVVGTVADGIGFNSDFEERASIICQPMFPHFQKTDGDLITPNSRESTSVAGFTPTVIWTPDNVALGQVRIDGDNFFVSPNSELLISSDDMYDVNTFDATFVSHFTPVSTAERSRSVFLGNRLVEDGSIFCTPAALSYGSYRIAVANRKSNFPNTTIESGVISTYPEPSGFSINTNTLRESTTQQKLQGYEAFDECFWVNEGSGLALISPISARPMWVRAADHEGARLDTNTGWNTSVGLEVVGGSVYKMVPNSFGGDVVFLEFSEETLDYVGSHTGSIGTANLTVEDMTHDGTNFWVIDSGASSEEVFKFDASFNFVQGWEASTAGFSLRMLSWIPSKSKFYVADAAFGSTSPIELVDVSFPSADTVPTIGTSKPIINFLGPAIRNVYDIIEVSTSTQIGNGIYALCNISGVQGGGPGYINEVGVIKIEEVGGEWLVRSQQVIQNVNFRRFAPESRKVNFRFRAVP